MKSLALFLWTGSNPAEAGSQLRIQKSKITAGCEVQAEEGSLALSRSVRAVDVESRSCAADGRRFGLGSGPWRRGRIPSMCLATVLNEFAVTGE